MKLLPPPGPERRRLFVLIGALLVLGALYLQFGPSVETPMPTATGPAAPAPGVALGALRGSNAPAAATTQARATEPQPLKLRELDERVPDEPAANRNLFRFGVKPVPPPPPAPPPPPYVPPPYVPPPPPAIPPIPLKLTVIIEDPYEPGRRRAYLTDAKTGAAFEGIKGQTIDGRYKLLEVGVSSVVMSYLDGSGRRTISLGG